MLNLHGKVIQENEWGKIIEYESINAIIWDMQEIDEYLSESEAYKTFIKWLANGTNRIMEVNGKFLVQETI